MCGRCLEEFVGCATTSGVSTQGKAHAEIAGLYTSMCGRCLGEFVVGATAYGVSRPGKARGEPCTTIQACVDVVLGSSLSVRLLVVFQGKIRLTLKPR